MRVRGFASAIFLAAFIGSVVAWSEPEAANRCNPSSPRVIEAGPHDYLAKLKKLVPGDRLVLVAGVYDDSRSVPGLPLFGLHGTAECPIVITGPERGLRPQFRARPTHNTIRIADASYLVIRNLDLDGRGYDVDGVKAQGVSHHITIEKLNIRRHGASQQTVGISTKASAWNWVIRGNLIERAGTGIYLGHPDGIEPFIGGLIENNVITDSRGYALQIKHQQVRKLLPQMPTKQSSTIIRHNVFSKQLNAATGSQARPNVLVGHSPSTGAGTEDEFQIYGNFFYYNDTGECLLQGEGNIALHHNLFVNPAGNAVCIRPHNGVPRRVNVFNNTIVATGRGIYVRGGDPMKIQRVIRNIVFAGDPIRAEVAEENVTGAYADASIYLFDPFAIPGRINLVPRRKLSFRPATVPKEISTYVDSGLDFDGQPELADSVGAYGALRKAPMWWPQLSRKPLLTR